MSEKNPALGPNATPELKRDAMASSLVRLGFPTSITDGNGVPIVDQLRDELGGDEGIRDAAARYDEQVERGGVDLPDEERYEDADDESADL